MRIKRRIEGKTAYYDILTKQQADQQKVDYVYWKDAEVGEYAITDDDYVAVCYARNDYTDKQGQCKTFVKLTCGVGWTSRFTKINFEENHKYGVYSKTNPKRTWDQEEAGTTRAKNTVTAYAQMLLTDGKVDYNTLGKIYRPDQKIPIATVRRFLKQRVAKKMVEEKLKEILAKKSISKEFAVDNIVLALKWSYDLG